MSAQQTLPRLKKPLLAVGVVSLAALATGAWAAWTQARWGLEEL